MTSLLEKNTTAKTTLLIASLLAAAANASGPYNADGPMYTEEQLPEVYCMAQNIYYEARSSSLADRAATADVVLNRTADNRYPDTICGVIRDGKKLADGSMKRDACQFSWYCDGKPDIPKKGDAWAKAQLLAYQIVKQDAYRGLTEGSTHYHAGYVDPYWADSLQLVGTIGQHVFYRWN